MEEEKKEIVTDGLTGKNRLFIYNLVHGRSTSGNPLTVYEAYQNAGYDGDKHAAYQLKSRLETELMKAQISTGVSKSDIFKEIAGMMALPVVDKDGNPATGISVTNKIKLLQLAVKSHDMVKDPSPNVTAVQINFGSAPAPETPQVVVDVTPEKI